MNSITRFLRLAAMGSLAMTITGCASTQPAAPAEEPFPIWEYSRTRAETHERLGEITTTLLPTLDVQPPKERYLAMKQIVAFIREHIAPHESEVATLYEFADRQAGPRYTETMRYEHREIASKIAFLDALAQAPEPDVEMFRTRAKGLVTYMRIHIDTETNTIGVLVVDHELERRRDEQQASARN